MWNQQRKKFSYFKHIKASNVKSTKKESQAMWNQQRRKVKQCEINKEGKASNVKPTKKESQAMWNQ